MDTTHIPENDSSGPYLRIAGISKKFGGFTALRDISLDIAEGEFICFLGPSGCGKTTLLRIIAGLDVQTQGSIFQDGKDVSRLPPARRDFGIVFQSYALFPNLTVRKNIAYGLKSNRMSRGDILARVNELLELVDLADQETKYPAQLSGGQQQRVALARALATSPGLLLLDEPLSALDAKVRVRLRHQIKELHHKIGVTTVMVTHDQEEALTLADRIAVMNQAVIEQVGTPTEIYRNPATPFVADFVGTMNFLSGTMAEPGTVQMAGLKLKAGNETNGIPEGREVVVCIRPEDVLARDIVPGTPNAFEAVIEEMEFLGSFYRVSLQPKEARGEVFRADFSINLVRELGVAIGQTMPVAFAEERTLIFARSPHPEG